MEPLVSVIIPVYNSEKFLFDSLESIRIQTFKNFECIIINDGSKDESINIINQFVKKDNRFKVLNQENIGVGLSLNNGISYSKGYYIARMDSDDISHPKRLETQLNFLQKKQNQNIVLGSNYYVINEENKKLKRSHMFFSPVINKSKLLLGRVPVAHPTVMFRKDILKKFKYKKGISQDLDLWIRLIDYVDYYNTKKYLVYYRSHESQVTKINNNLSNKSNAALDMTHDLYKTMDYFINKEDLIHLSANSNKKVQKSIKQVVLISLNLIEIYNKTIKESNVYNRFIFIILFSRNVFITQKYNIIKSCYLIFYLTLRHINFILVAKFWFSNKKVKQRSKYYLKN